MNLVTLYNHIFNRVNKDQTGNTYRVDSFNTDMSFASMQIFNRCYGLPEQYGMGQPFPAMSWEVTQAITDSLRYCKVNMGGTNSDDPSALIVNNGVATIPLNYLHPSRMTYSKKKGTIKARNIEILTDAEYSSRLSNYTKNRNNEDYPYCNIQKDTIVFQPQWSLQYVNFVYLRAPNTPFLDYIENSTTGATIYLNPNQTYVLQPGQVYRTGQTSGQVTSQTVELEYPEYIMPDVAALIISFVSDNLRSSFLKSSSESQKRSGL